MTTSSYQKEYYEQNKEKLINYKKAWYQKNRERLLQKNQLWKISNPDYNKEYYQKNLKTEKKRIKDYYLKNKKDILDKANKRTILKKRTNVQFKLSCNLRNRINKILRGNTKAGSAVQDLGCSIEFLKSYLESKFKSGMSWENYGVRGWHVDHIQPLTSFDLTNRDQFLKACHYTNLQPLWYYENISKGGKSRAIRTS